MNYLYGIAADTISISASHVGAAKKLNYKIYCIRLQSFANSNG